MERTDNETAALARVALCLDDLRRYLHEQSIPGPDAEPDEWFAALSEVKAILGNFNNLRSFVACLLAKEFLARRFAMAPSDVALKPQGANGLDIDEWTTIGEHVIGEIKTTTPRQVARIEAEQMKSFRRDFAKLQLTAAEYKFMFVTDKRAFNALLATSTAHLSGVSLVCLTTGDEYAVPALTPTPELPIRQVDTV